MVVGEKPNLYLYDFSGNMLSGIVEIAKNHNCRDLLRGWYFNSPSAHRAAVAAYTYLEELDIFDLNFSIFLHGIYGESADWTRAITFELYTVRTICQWVPDGDFEILSSMNDLVERMQRDGAVGTREIWMQCAQTFIHEYENR